MENLPEEDNNTNILSDESPNRSDELPQNDTEEYTEEVQFEWFAEYMKKLPQKQQGRVNGVQVNTLSSHSMFNKDLTAAPKTFTFMEYSSAVLYSVFLMSSHSLGGLVTVIPSIICYRAKALTVQFASKSGIQSPLSTGEAFIHFYPQTREMMLIILCCLLMLWLVLPLNPVLRFSFVLVLIGAPFYYIPELVGMASGIDVTCGFFSMPLIWFTVSVALVCSPIPIFLTLLAMYLFQRHIHPVGARVTQFNSIHPRGPSVKEVKISLDALSGGDKTSTG